MKNSVWDFIGPAGEIVFSTGCCCSQRPEAASVSSLLDEPLDKLHVETLSTVIVSDLIWAQELKKGLIITVWTEHLLSYGLTA